MQLLESILDIFREQKSEFGALSPHSICYMKAPLIGTNSIINSDGSLTTWIAVNGSYFMLGEEKFSDFEDNLYSRLKGLLREKGRSISISYNKDNFLTKNSLKENNINARKKINHGFKLAEIIKQQEVVLMNRVTYEQAYISITTSPNVQPKNTAKKSLKNARQAFNASTKKYLENTQANYTQMPKIFIKDIVKRHESFVTNIKNILEYYLDVKILDPERVVSELRKFHYPESSTPHFKARLVGSSATVDVSDVKEHADVKKRTNIIETNKKGAGNDISNLLYPTIAEQIILSDAEIEDDNCKETGVKGIVRIGSKYYTPIIVSAPSESHTRFDDLFQSIDFRIPFRMTMNFETGNDRFLSKLNTIQLKSTILTVTNSDNKRIREASQILINDYKQGNDVPLNTYTLFLTWGRTPEEADSNRDNVIAAIQSWGATDAIPEYGDPYLSCLESIPGFTKKRTAPGFIQGLKEVIRMLPFTRPSSPWKNGSLMFYTRNNKMWSYSIGSSMQSTWIELISAGPGSGKSVFMAGSNLSLINSSPQNSLPKIGIIDVGPSSKYMIDFIKATLPEDMKDETASYRIKMDERYAFNPFDTMLGCRYLVESDKSFLINFLSLVLRQVDSEISEKGSTELITILVDEVYKRNDPEISPNTCKKYTKNQIPELENVLEKYDFNPESDSTPLFKIVDMLMDMEDYKTANIVQRYAVPLLGDLSTVLTTSRIIKDQYNDEKSLNLIQTFGNQIQFATEAYPIITRPTVFDVGNASIVSLDLGEIVQSGSDNPKSKRTSQITYMLARYMLGKNYYRDVDTVMEKAIPEKYREYHKRWIEKEHIRIKRLCMDEFHTTNGNDSILNQVHMDCRTGRKYNVVVTLASQRDEDFSKTLRELATTTFIMGGSSNNTVRNRQVKEYGLDKDTADALINYLGPPNQKGSSMIVTGQAKTGQFNQMLYYLLPPIVMWALSTTTEDVDLRNYVTAREGDYIKALTKLSYVFRQGTAKSLFENYKSNFTFEVSRNSTIEEEICKIMYDNEISKIKINEEEEII